MKKKNVILILTALILVLILTVFAYWISPVKHAIKEESLKNTGEHYYLIKYTQTTVSMWKIIGDNTGYYQTPKYVILEGDVPDIVKNYDIAIGDNVYVCYGEYIGEKETPAQEILSAYNLTGWDILYPVKRDSVFQFWPKSYISRMDINGMD